ncbi:internalin, putative [Euzebya pacifica]|uniref:Internalin, putative n=1 Tax=Euzebya pacifica TaxID=1608957 RepID=A0A346XU34_9ACTN|nr:internalin, putative [Euzebya pacifica]
MPSRLTNRSCPAHSWGVVTSRWLGTASGVLALAASMLLALPTMPARAQVAPTGPTFSCADPAGYLFQDSPTDAIEVNLVTGATAERGSDLIVGGSNAWGYNRTDDYFWGRHQGDGLVRVDADWTVYDYDKATITRVDAAGAPVAGSLADLPATIAGDVDANGVLHLVTNTTPARIYRVDVNPASPTYLKLLPDVVLSEASGLADAVFNSVDGLLYGVRSDLTVIRINPNTGTITPLGQATGGMPAGGYGGGFMDVAGNLYLSHNGSGEIWTIESPHTGNTAAEHLATGDPSSINDGGRCATAPALLAPGLTVTKTGTATSEPLVAGEDIDYTIRARNTGNAVVDAVDVTDPLIPGAALTCVDEAGGAVALPVDLDPGAFVDCTGTYTVTPDDAADNEVVNTATATGTVAGDPIQATGTTTVPAPTPTPALALTKTTDFAETEIAEGDVVDYTITATNTGNVALTGVGVTDPVVDLTCLPAVPTALEPNQAVVCTGAYTITAGDLPGPFTNTATVSAPDPTGGPSITATDSVDVPAAKDPELTVAKTSDNDGTPPAEGDVITYTIVVDNTGNVPASGVTVSDPLVPDDLVCVPAVPVDLQPGDQVVCTAPYTITAGDVGVTVTNTATATGQDPDGNPITGSGSTDVPGPVPDPSLVVTKTASTASVPATVGDIVNYEVVVENDGNVTVTDVVVADPLVAGLDCMPAVPRALAPGARVTCTASHTVTQADIDTGAYLAPPALGNTATATGVDPTGTPVDADDSVDIVVPSADPDLTVTKVSDFTGDTLTAGETIGYTITTENTGNVTVSGVDVTDSRIDDLVCAPATPVDLGPGQQVVCTGTYTVTAGDEAAGSVTNNAFANGADPADDPVAATGSSTVPAPPDPELTITATPDDDLVVGEDTTFTIVVENTGNVPIDDVQVTDPNPDLTITCTPPMGSTLEPGAQMVCTGTITVTPAHAADGSLLITPSTDGDDPSGGPVTDTDSAVAPVTPDPALTITKTAAPAGTVHAGEAIDYTIEVVNTGNVTITDVEVTDPLIPLTCAPTTPRALVPGGALTCTGTYTVTPDDGTAGHVDNTATAHGTDPSGAPTTDTDSVTVTTLPAPPPPPAGGGGTPPAGPPELTVTTTIPDSGPFEPGDPVDYVVTITNTGGSPIADVDVPDADLDCDPPLPATLQPGESIECTGTHVVTNDEGESGEVRIPVTAVGNGPDGTPVSGSGEDTAPVGDDGSVPDPDPVPDVDRIAGPTRIDTAIEVSNADFEDGTARVVILARDDVFADALSGTPLAVAEAGPILLTRTDELLPSVTDEIRRVLGEQGRIYLLGGVVALDDEVEAQAGDLGYPMQRLQGPSRIETAIAIAEHLGDPDEMLIAGGEQFADALTAAAVAGARGGAILLTSPGQPHPSVDAYLSDKDPVLWAVGGPAVGAYPAVTPVAGPSRDATAVAVAETFYDDPGALGFARLDDFPDALTGGAHIARQPGPLLLTQTDFLPDVVTDYVCRSTTVTQGYVYGGTAAVSDEAFDELTSLFTEGCG